MGTSLSMMMQPTTILELFMQIWGGRRGPRQTIAGGAPQHVVSSLMPVERTVACRRSDEVDALFCVALCSSACSAYR
jgi:hypothetical protein